MSTTVDERVVEMRFDNAQFERNVSTTMSTLERLKQKLNLTGASKGLENVNAAANNINMSGLSSAVETVQAKFSALDVMAVTTLANITNSAVNAGKKIVSALTIDPIKTGFQEYETQINAVQTILANTSSKGTTIDDVNDALDKLNTYADQTIYNFTEMTRNIGTFTAAGVDLDTSVNAIQGIANLAAVSGSTSQQASTAMYQLSQALAAGTVKLQDWNSVVNAGMGGEVFQNALKRTAKVMGTDVDALIEKYGSFRESLSRGEWLTTDVLTETLNQFTMAAEEGTEQWEEYKKSLKEKGYTEEQAVEILKMANTATEAATKVKTFTQLWDVLKESAQSGWTQTWEMIIGDYEEAKNLLSPLSDALVGIINKMSKMRNDILGSALGKTFTGLVDNVKNVVKPIQNSAESVKEVVNSVKDYASVVDEIIGGKWGNGQERWDKLTEAGYDWAHAQNLVNEKLGDSTRHATDYAEAQNGVTEATDSATESTTELTEAEKQAMIQLANMTDEQLRAQGYTEDQIASINELRSTADKLGLSVEDFLNNLNELDGRWLIINSFKNAGQGLITVFKAIGQAWREAFHGEATDDEILAKRSEALFNIIAAVHKFSTMLKVSDDTAGDITRTFKGLFAIIDLITTITGGGLKIAFKAVSAILGYFHLDILDVTASVGDALVKFRDWVDSLLDFNKVIDKVAPFIENAAEAIRGWIDGMKDAEDLPKYIADGITNGFKYAIKTVLGVVKELGTGVIESIKDYMGMEDGEEISGDLISGFINGVKDGVGLVIQTIIELGKNILEEFKGILGIHSPSTETYDDGYNFIQGFINGIKDFASDAWESIKEFGSKCIEKAKEIDWGTVFAIGVSVAAVAFIKKIGDALESFAAPFEGLGAIFEETSKVVKSFGKITKAIALDIKTKALKNLAIALLILAGSVIALTYFYTPDMWKAVGIIGVLALVLVGLSFAVSKMSDTSVKLGKEGASIDGLKQSLLSVAGAILLLAVTVKMVGSMNTRQAIQGFVGLAGIMAAMIGFLWACKKVTSRKALKDISNIGSLMIKLSVAMLLMIGVIKLAGKLSEDEMIKGAAFAGAFVIFVGLLNLATQKSGKHINKVGGMLIKITLAMALMVGVVKLASKLTPSEMLKGAVFAAAFVLFVKSLVKATRITKFEQIAKLGGLLLSITVSMALMVGVCKLVSLLTPEEILKGVAFVAAFVLFVKALVKVTTIGSEQKTAKVAGTILMMSLAIGVLAIIAMMLSLLSIEGLVKGITAVGLLSGMMALMIRATKGAQNVKGALIVMAVAIGVMAAAVAGLSFIDTKKLAGATLAMSMVMGMFALIIKSGKNMGKGMGSLIVMTVAVGVLAGILWRLSALDVQASLTNAAALSLLMIAMSGVLFILSKITSKAIDALKGIGLLTAMVIPMMAFVAVLHFMPDITVAKEKVTLLIGVMIAMTLLLGVLTIIGTFGLNALIGVGLLTAMVVPMMAFVAVLHFMPDITVAKERVTLLVGVMTAMTLLLGVLAVIGILAIPALAGILALTAMVIPMMAFVAVIHFMPDITVASENIALLMDMMTIMTGLLVQLAIVGPMALIGVAALQGLVLVITEVGVLAGILGALVTEWPSIQTCIETGLPLLEKLAFGIGSIVSNFAAGLTSQLPQIGSDLSDFMDELSGFIEGAGGIGEDVKTGVSCLTDAIMALTVANLINGIASLIAWAPSLPQLGTDLSDFIENAGDFITGISDFTPEVATAAESMAKTILILTAADLLSGIAAFKDKIFGGGGLSGFGEQLSAFGSAIAGFSKAIVDGGGIDTEAVTAAANAGAIMAELQSKLYGTEGVIQWFCGEKDLSTFGTQLKAYGEAIVEFSKTVSADGAINEDAITAAKDMGLIMVELQEAVKPVNGVAQILAGTTDLATFGTQLKNYGQALVDFSTIVSAEGAINEDAITAAKDMGLIMTELQSAITPSEGVWQWLSGKTDLTTFGTQVEAFGTAIVNFSKTVSEGGIDDEAITAAANAGTIMAKLQEAIPDDKWFDGKVSLDDFGKDIEDFGGYIAKYSEKVAGIDHDAVSGSISSASRLVYLAKSLVDLDTSGIENFKVNSIGESIKTYYDKVESVDQGVVSDSITSANRLVSFIKSLVGLETTGVSSFQTAVNNLGRISLDGFVNVFNNSTTRLVSTGANMVDSLIRGARTKLTVITTTGRDLIDGFIRGVDSKKSRVISTVNQLLNDILRLINDRGIAFKTVGSEIMTQFVSGIGSQSPNVKTEVTSSLIDTLNGVNDYYDSFYSAGSYLVDGFANGISENSYKAAAKAKAMAEAAKKAAEKALGINSPSKVFYAIGDYTGQGFINALSDYGTKSYSAGSEMANSARSGLSDAISKIRDVINSDMDTQPTIRPVLDLSNVESGAGAISSMLNATPSVGLMSNIGSISSMMNNNQNGGNADVVSAINDLRKDLGSIGGTSYSINGITYDDGSSISDAVQSLVRAARVERRI